MPFLVGEVPGTGRKHLPGKELRGIVEAGVQTEEDVKTGRWEISSRWNSFWCSTVANGKSNQI